MTRRTLRIGLLAALAATLALAGCSPVEPGLHPSLDDTEWILEQWGQPGNLRLALPDRDATLGFSGNSHATGNAGCNGWGGSCTIAREGTISFTDIIHTEMYCTDPGVMEQEQFFLDALAVAENYKVVDGKLHITGGGKMLVLSPA